jgi:hypothetical protein
LKNKLDFTIGLPVRNRVSFANNALSMMLKNSSYPIIVVDDNSDNPDDKYLKNERIKVIYNNKKNGLVSLWNQLIKESKTENIIIGSYKIRPKKSDFNRIEKRLLENFGFVSTKYFHFFAFNKSLLGKIGIFDEGFTNGNFEDTDFLNRLYINDIGIYFSHETNEDNSIFTNWGQIDRGENKRYYDTKWIFNKENHALTLFHDEKNINERMFYSKKYKSRDFLAWTRSIIKDEDLKNNFTGLKFIDKRKGSIFYTNLFYRRLYNNMLYLFFKYKN